MKNIGKIFGAVAIIGLFFISSMSTGLSAITPQPLAAKKVSLVPQIQKEKVQEELQIQGEQHYFVAPSDEDWLDNIMNTLPEVTEEMDGTYEDPAYQVPESWGWEETETLDIDPDVVGTLGILQPNLKITEIAIHRGGLTAWFEVTVKDLRLLPIALSTHTLVVVTKLGIPVHFRKHFTLPIILPFTKREIDVRMLGGLPFPWTFTGGGSVIAWPDCNDRYDEGVGEYVPGIPGDFWDWSQDHDIRIRHFMSNLV